MRFAVYVFCVFAVALAWAVARRRSPEHRPVAWLLTAGLAIDLLTVALREAVFAPLRAEVGDAAWTGWARHAAVVANGLNLAWPAAVVAAALVVFAGRRPWPALLAWAAAVAGYAIVHPVASGQARFLGIVQALAALASAGLGVAWYRRARKPATTAQLAMAIIVTAELSSLLGAWTHGVFDQWPVSQALYMTMYGALIIMQGRFLWLPSAQPSS